jgi:hypothetical protein
VLIAFVAFLKVNHDNQREGIGSTFFKDLAEYAKKEACGKLYNASYFVVHQSIALKSHAFYKKLGFVKAPLTLDSWKMEGSDLAVCDIEKFRKSASFIKLAVSIFPLNFK